MWDLPLFWHAVALAALLLVTLLVIVPSRLGNADEGAALSQTQLLLDGEGWSMTHPLPAADPDALAFPIGNSAHVVGTTEYVPFAKHPLYPVLLMPFVAAFGVAGAALVSVLGTVAAALSGALLSARLDSRLGRPALWFIGVATPLWVDSFVTIAHTIGAAFVGFAALVLLRPRVGARAVIAGSALLVLAVLFRNEAILLGVALAAVLGVSALVDRDRRRVAVAAAAFGATVAGFVLDRRLEALALGGAPVESSSATESVSFLAGRMTAFAYTVLAPSDRTVTGLLLSTIGAILVVAAAVTVRRRPADGSGILVFLGGAVVAELLRWFVEPNAHIPGLVFAAPLLVGGLVLLDRATLARRDVMLLVGTCALFFLAVLATQSSNGGGGGWGGRYFAIALPLIVPVALVAVHRAGQTIAPRVRPAAVALCVAVALIITLSASSSLLIDHRLTGNFEAAVASATAGLDAGDGDSRPVVVSTRPGLGRLAYRLVLDQRWLEVAAEDEDVVPYFERLRALGIRRLVVVTDEPDETIAAIVPLYDLVSARSVTTEDPRGREIVYAVKVLVLEAVNGS
jgi:hypothetical protein